MLRIRGKPGKNPKGKLAFPLGFSRAFLGQKPTNYRLLNQMADVAVFSPCSVFAKYGSRGLTPWRRSGGAEPPAFPFAVLIFGSKIHDSSYFVHSCVSPGVSMGAAFRAADSRPYGRRSRFALKNPRVNWFINTSKNPGDWPNPVSGTVFAMLLVRFSNRNEENETNTVISTAGEPEANRSGEI